MATETMAKQMLQIQLVNGVLNNSGQSFAGVVPQQQRATVARDLRLIFSLPNTMQSAPPHGEGEDPELLEVHSVILLHSK